MALKSYSSVAAANTSLFPENMAPSALNDGNRQVQADTVTQFRDAEWIDWGDGVSRASASTFKIAADVTSRYLVNRRVRCNDASTLYGVVTASSYSAPDTTVTVGLDSGSLTASLTAVSLAILAPSNISVPTTIGRKGADIASAGTVDLTTATGDFVDVTGTTTITAFGTIAAGVQRTVRFTGALTITHNGTSLILPGGSNITTVAGDVGIFRSLGSGNWVCVSFTGSASDAIAIVQGSADSTKKLRIEADGITTATTRVWTAPDTDLSAFVVQRVSTQTGALATGTTALPIDDTIPQNTEGDEYMTRAITPKSASNILKIEVTCLLSNEPNASVVAALFQDSTAGALAAMGATPTSGGFGCINFIHTMTAGTTSATTFKIRGGSASGTTTFNGVTAARRFGGVMASSIVITEYSS